VANLKQTARDIEARAKRKLARGTVDLALPIFDGAYGARFGVLGSERLAELEAIGADESMTAEAANDAAAEFVFDACRQILARGDGKGYEPLTHDDGRPVRFDEEFAEALELEPPAGKPSIGSGADVVLSCWTTDTGELNGPALNNYAIRLLTWMQDTTSRVEGELVGESQGTRP
jgi:hypothetical protein